MTKCRRVLGYHDVDFVDQTHHLAVGSRCEKRIKVRAQPLLIPSYIYVFAAPNSIYLHPTLAEINEQLFKPQLIPCCLRSFREQRDLSAISRQPSAVNPLARSCSAL